MVVSVPEAAVPEAAVVTERALRQFYQRVDPSKAAPAKCAAILAKFGTCCPAQYMHPARTPSCRTSCRGMIPRFAYHTPSRVTPRNKTTHRYCIIAGTDSALLRMSLRAKYGSEPCSPGGGEGLGDDFDELGDEYDEDEDGGWDDEDDYEDEDEDEDGDGAADGAGPGQWT